MAVDQSLMVLPDNKQKQGVYRRGSVAKSPSEGAAALRTDLKGASGKAEIASFLGEVTKWFPTYAKEVDKKNKEEMEEQVAEYKNASPANKLAFRKAIAEGDIESRFSPWKMEGLRKAKAQEETRNYGNALFSKYMKSPVRGSDDPEVMRNFIDQHNSEFKENINGISNNILNNDFFPTRDALINSLIQRHKEYRAKEFEKKSDNINSSTQEANADTLVDPGKSPIHTTTVEETTATNIATQTLDILSEKKNGKLTKKQTKSIQTLYTNTPPKSGNIKNSLAGIIVENDGVLPKITQKEPVDSSITIPDVIANSKLKELATQTPQSDIAHKKVNLITKEASELEEKWSKILTGNSNIEETDPKPIDGMGYDFTRAGTALITPKKGEAPGIMKEMQKAMEIAGWDQSIGTLKVVNGKTVGLFLKEKTKDEWKKDPLKADFWYKVIQDSSLQLFGNSFGFRQGDKGFDDWNTQGTFPIKYTPKKGN